MRKLGLAQLGKPLYVYSHIKTLSFLVSVDMLALGEEFCGAMGVIQEGWSGETAAYIFGFLGYK